VVAKGAAHPHQPRCYQRLERIEILLGSADLRAQENALELQLALKTPPQSSRNGARHAGMIWRRKENPWSETLNSRLPTMSQTIRFGPARNAKNAFTLSMVDEWADHLRRARSRLGHSHCRRHRIRRCVSAAGVDLDDYGSEQNAPRYEEKMMLMCAEFIRLLAPPTSSPSRTSLQ